MKKKFFKLMAAIKFGYWSYKNTEIFNEPIIKMMGGLLEFIVKVANEQKPYMTEIAMINTETKTHHEIVTLWAGAGLGAEPTKRIKELVEENEMLKAKLSYHFEDKK